MVDVTGRIGSEQVELNNAATEATLRMLLQATLSANKQNHDDIAKMAKQAGLDPASVAAANENLDRVAATGKKTEGAFYTLGLGTGVAVEGFKKLDTALSPLISQLLAGTDKASVVFGTLEKFAGPLSGVVNIFGRLAKFQEENLEAYQKMAKAGVNFGGSLTDMRTAAASTYMTLDQFGQVMKENAGTFAKMGGSVNDGAKAFIAISNTLNKSALGSDLRALGYTSQEVNQGMIDYIGITGGRTRKELQNTEQLAKAGANYLENLDGLSKLTGESKDALAAKMKQDAANEAWQMYLLTLDEVGREKANKANLEANARGGKGAAEALQARLMGLPPQTEAAKKFVGTLQNGNAAVNKLADDVNDSSKSLKDMDKTAAGVSVGMAADGERLKQVGSAILMSGKGGEEFSKALGAANNATRNGIKSTEDQIAFEAKIKTEAKAQKESEAKAAVDTQKAVQELGQTVLAALLPAIKLLTPIMNTVVGVFGAIVKVMNEYKTVTIALAAAAAAYLIIQKTQQILSAVKAAKAAGGGVRGMLGALTGGGGGPLGSSPNSPMWVKIAGGGVLGGEGKGSPLGGGGSGGGGGGIGSNVAAGLGGLGKGLQGLLSGLGKGAGQLIKGILSGLAGGLKLMGDPKVMLGIVSVGLLGGAMMIAGKAFKEFTGVNWGDVLIGSVVLTGLAVGASALVGIAPFIGITAVAIGLLGAAIWVLAKGLKEFPTFAIPGMSEAFEGFGKIVGNVFGFVGDVVSGLIDTVKKVFGTVWDIISWPFKKIGSLISGTIDVVSGMFKTLWDIVSWPFKQLGNLISGTVNVVTGMFGILWDVISFPFKMIGSLISGTIDVITGMFGTIWNVVSWPFKQLGNLISGTVGVATDIFKGMVDVISAVFGTVWDVVSWPFKQLGNLVSGTVDGITSIFTGMVDGISAVFGTVWDILSSPFKMIGALVSSVFDGISGAIKFVIDKLSNILGMIGSVIKGVAGFVGRLFGGDSNKDEKGGGGLNSPEFTKATSVLLEAANKMNAAGDKLMAGGGAGGNGTPLAAVNGTPNTGGDGISSTIMNKAMSSIFKPNALDLPPMSEDAMKYRSTMSIFKPNALDLPPMSEDAMKYRSTMSSINDKPISNALAPVAPNSPVAPVSPVASNSPVTPVASNSPVTPVASNSPVAPNSPMDKIKDILSTLGLNNPQVSAAKQAGGAVSSAFGNISGSKTTEFLSKEIETLNKNTIEMLKQLKEIADHTRQGVSATKSLGGDLFKF